MCHKKILISTYFFLILYMHDADSIKVCKAFRDYYIPHSKNCYDNPDNKLNTSQIIRRWGFTSEEHYVTTDDGYKLLMVRAFLNITQNTTTILGPGMQTNSLVFVTRGRKSLAYILVEHGFDVWIINYRGTRYSQEHVNLTTNDNTYWKFSTHELAVYDLRASINTIYAKTKKNAIYIAVSAGTSVGYIYATTNPIEARERLAGMIMASPVGYFKPDPRSVWNIGLPIFPMIRQLVYKLFHGENLKPPVTDLFKIFSHSPDMMYIGQTLVSMLAGWNYRQMDPETLPIFFQQVPDSFGIDVIGHFFQWQKSQRFQYYDYGHTRNLELYGQAEPPLYDLSKISVPISLFVGENDWVAPKEAAMRTYLELQQAAKCGFHTVKDKSWTHLDSMEGKNIIDMLYNPMIRVIDKMKSGRCRQE